MYEIGVTNTGDALAFYDLSDSLMYGTGVTVVAATPEYVAGGDGLGTTLNVAPYTSDSDLVMDESVDVMGTDTYKVTVVFTVDPNLITTTTADCTLDSGESGTGLLNKATVDGATPLMQDTACVNAPIPSVSFKKSISVDPVSTGNPSEFTIQFALEISNTGNALAYYTLTDTFKFGPGIIPTSTIVTYDPGNTDGQQMPDNMGFDGTTDYLIVTDEAISIGESETWFVDVIFTVIPNLVTDMNGDCVIDPGETGSGLTNVGSVGGATPIQQDTTCAPVPCLFTVVCPTNTFIGSITCIDDAPSCIVNVDDFEAIDPTIDNIGDTPCGEIVILCEDSPVGAFCSDQTITRTYTIFDDIGDGNGGAANGILDAGELFETCIFTYTILADTDGPVLLTCPVNITLECGSSIDTSILGVPTYMDQCSDDIAVTFIDEVSGFDGTCTNNIIGTINRIFVATDVCGNADSSCVQTITITDFTAPTIVFVDSLLTSGDTLSIQCEGQDSSWALPDMGINDVMATDICENNIDVEFIDVVETDGSCAVDGFFRRFRCTWIATDECGNSAEVYLIVDLVDNIAPVLVGVPADITVSCNDIPAPATVKAEDECLCVCSNVEFTEVVEDNAACGNDHSILRIWSVADYCGNTTIDTQRVFLIDKSAPAIIIVEPLIVNNLNDGILEFECSDGFPAWLLQLGESAVEVADACSNTSVTNVDITKSEGNCLIDGYYEQLSITWEAEDACGNIASLNMKANLVDRTAPEILIVEDQFCANDLEQLEVFAFDNCTQNPRLEYEDQFINDSDCGKLLRRIYTAYDHCGNTATDTIMIQSMDNINPEVIFVNPLLENYREGDTVVLSCQSGIEKTISGFGVNDIAATDNCPLELEVLFQEKIIAEGDCSSDVGLFTLELIWKVTDACGNETRKIVTAIINDDLAPYIPELQDTTYFTCGDEIPEFAIVDNCDLRSSNLVVTIEPGDCPGSEIRKYKANAVDACGNILDKTYVIVIQDLEGPVIKLADYACHEVDTNTPVFAYDKCLGRDVVATLINTSALKDCNGAQIVERTYQAEDACGNISIRTQRQIIGDVTGPSYELLDERLIELFASSPMYINASDQDLIDYLMSVSPDAILPIDACSNADYDFNRNRIQLDDCTDEGVREVINLGWILTDACDNTTEVQLIANIIDDIAPSLLAEPADEIVYCGELPQLPAMNAVDNYGIYTVVFDTTTEPTENGHILIREWIFSDLCGNETRIDQRVEMVDNTGLSCNIIAPAVIDCNSRNNILTADVIGSDGPYTYEWVVIEGACLIELGQGTDQIEISIGFFDVTIELTVYDIYGCSTTCTFVIDCKEKPESSSSLITNQHNNNLNNNSQTSYEILREIENPTSFTDMEVYPNPTRDYIEFRIPNRSIGEVAFIEAYDMNGKLIRKEQVQSNHIKWNIHDWEDGMYYLTYVNNDGRKQFKITKMKY